MDGQFEPACPTTQFPPRARCAQWWLVKFSPGGRNVRHPLCAYLHFSYVGFRHGNDESANDRYRQSADGICPADPTRSHHGSGLRFRSHYFHQRRVVGMLRIDSSCATLRTLPARLNVAFSADRTWPSSAEPWLATITSFSATTPGVFVRRTQRCRYVLCPKTLGLGRVQLRLPPALIADFRLRPCGHRVPWSDSRTISVPLCEHTRSRDRRDRVHEPVTFV